MRRIYLFLEENDPKGDAFKKVFIETSEKYVYLVDFVILKIKEDWMIAKYWGLTSAPTLVYVVDEEVKKRLVNPVSEKDILMTMGEIS